MPIREFMNELPEALHSCNFADQIENVWRHFPRNQLLVLRFQEMVDAPNETIRRCFEFLELPILTSTSHRLKNNRTDYQANRQVMKILKTVKNVPLVGRSLSLMPNELRAEIYQKVVTSCIGKRLAAGHFKQLDPYDNSLKTELQSLFRPSIDRLEQILGWDLTDWKATTHA
ncbi:Sulfotransferase domain protein [Roseimaritima multifibrata]|uniref:Sulfotransferase domain protein n=2 Tax=Roseimaritima multifibrata TaxID=1930274 RepID=A0A517MMF7_9BACT|nr:Sulfotransferase domain protein [Roseimaritima multifibrata]